MHSGSPFSLHALHKMSDNSGTICCPLLISETYIITTTLYKIEGLQGLHKIEVDLAFDCPSSCSITKTSPCNIQQYFTAVKMFIFR